MFYLDIGDHCVVGASPELLVRVEDGVVTNHPIAGTRPRGSDPKHDAELAEELLADEKERAEHIMLVDLGRNDVGRVSKPGTVRVPRLMEIERFSHVMHIVSNVEGEISDEFSPLDALRACFPAGTVSGAPKVRAMEIIAELEVDRRGVYSGRGRVRQLQRRDGHLHRAADAGLQGRRRVVQAGGGIVLDSTPDGEYAESFHKMRALVRAIELAESIESRGGERDDPADRQLRFVHLQPLPVPGGAWRRGEVVRNDKITVDEIRARRGEFDRIVISPGPCTPAEAGICVPLIQQLAGEVPILGVCLGHQSIGAAFGATVVRAPMVLHGKTSEIYHGGNGVFAGLPSPFTATRYHSLIVERETLPPALEITAETADGVIMGLRHRELPVEGVQFHPESILTPVGKQLLGNFLGAPVAVHEPAPALIGY